MKLSNFSSLILGAYTTGVILTNSGCSRLQPTPEIPSVVSRAPFGIGERPARTSTYRMGKTLYLKSTLGNKTAIIGLNTSWGGAITIVSLNGTNYVNAHDDGREVQPALYDGAEQYETYCGKDEHWGWDPVLGGDCYGHGSPILSTHLTDATIYTKARPLQWAPSEFGGGPNKPIPTDMAFAQLVSTAPGAPLAFQIHLKLTQRGKGQYYNAAQELPAVYTDTQFNTLIFYAGTKPWTSGKTTAKKANGPCPKKHAGLFYSSELWESYVNSAGDGLTLYVPGQYPYIRCPIAFPGSGSNATNYFSALAPFTVSPKSSFEGDIFLIPGPYRVARQIIYELHKNLPNADPFAPLGNTDSPTAHQKVSGTTSVSGWAFDHDGPVESVSVYVDGVDKGMATYGLNRKDVGSVFYHAPIRIGFDLELDTTTLKNGSHTVVIHAVDRARKTALFPPVPFIVKN